MAVISLASQRHCGMSLHEWSVGMDGCMLFRKDRLGRRGGGVALYFNDQLVCMELCLGMDDELTENLRVRIQGRQDRPPDQEEQTDEALYRRKGVTPHSQALVIMGNFSHPYVHWRNNTAGYKQSKRILECTDYKFLLQVTEQPMRRGAILFLVPTNKEVLVGNVRVQRQPWLQ